MINIVLTPQELLDLALFLSQLPEEKIWTNVLTARRKIIEKLHDKVDNS